MRAVLGLLLLSAVVCAEDEVDAYRFVVATGQYVDLDTGTVLAREFVGDLDAELRLARSGQSFHLQPLGRAGAQAGRGDVAPAQGYEHGPLELGQDEQVWFVVTRAGAFARVVTQVGNAYNLGAVSLHVQVNRAGTRAFPEPPAGLEARWENGVLHVSWEGEPGRFLVTASAGEQRAAAEAEACAAELKELTPGRQYRVEVRRVAEDGLRSAPAVGSFAAGPRRLRCGEARFEGRWFSRNGGLDIAGLRAFAEADPHIVFYLYGAYAPGGLVHAGRGEKAFHELQRLPTDGYRPFHHRLDDGDVFAVRTVDGRYGKVMIRGDGGDYRNGMVALVTFLESGGFTLPSRPLDPAWKRVGDRFDLRWSAVEGAIGYQVWIAGAGSLYEGAAPSCSVKDLPPRQVIELRVRARFADGLRSEPTSLVLHTFPPRFRVGRFTLDARGSNGWSFTDDCLVAAPKAGELFISNSAGGASSLRLTGKNGIGRPRRLEWGELPPPGARDWIERNGDVNTDDREPASQRFWVVSEEGGVASLRIESADYPNVTFEYVYAKPLWAIDAAAFEDGKLVWKAVQGAKSYVVRVGGAALRTDGTEIVLPKLKRNAFHRIELYAVFANGNESEPYVVETDTFSEAYRRGEIDVVPWGGSGVSLTKGCPATPGEELELRLLMVGRDRIKVDAPFGVSANHGLRFGEFPPRREKAALDEEVRFGVDDLEDRVLLVRTADGGLASVVATPAESRMRRIRLRYVLRRPLDLAQALRDIARAAPEPSAADAERAHALVARLGAADARVREQALRDLVALGLEGARPVLAAREQSADPDLRAMLERWAFAVYVAELE